MTDDDPNEAYEVVPIEPGPRGPPKSSANGNFATGEFTSEAGQSGRSSDGLSGRSRVGSKGLRSVVRATPSAISSARASPVAGALRMPQTLWPVAT